MTPTFYWQQTVPPNLQMGEETVHQAMHTVFACAPPFFLLRAPELAARPYLAHKGCRCITSGSPAHTAAAAAAVAAAAAPLHF